MKFFETHAHYSDDIFKNNQEEILKKCKDANIEYIIDVGYNTESSKKTIDLASKYDYVYSAIGIHPHDVAKDDYHKIYDLYQEKKNDKVVAIGEIGLDYAFVKDNKKEQIELFINQIELANTLKLPIIIHSREAYLDTYHVIKENKAEYGTLFHCFHPNDDLVRLVLENGYMVAFGGNITYKRSKKFTEYVRDIPLEQIVIETDSPYLPPEPYRGTVNTSLNLPIICAKLAEMKNLDVEDVSKAVFQNAKDFFKV
ncbi:MAG: TatD family hydrolase [Clostridia bacterium]|nr:TatD family hydrolase [Clostridia bacterium]